MTSHRPKIVLYNPRAVFFTMPLGLVAVGSALDPERYRIVIIDGRLEKDPVARVLEETRDALCLGLGVLTGRPIDDALALTRVAKERRGELPVVWGGWHPSLFAEETLAEPGVDIVVQGQGERALRTIADALAAGSAPSDLSGIPGLAVSTDDGVVVGPPAALTDLNELPSHDYGLIDVERYFALKGKRQLDYVSSVGCPFRCAFCADPFVYRRRWSGLEPERIGEELEQLWRRHRFAEVAFQDETFFTYRERIALLAEDLLQREARFSWSGTLRADQGARMSEDDFALCARSGLRQVMVGVEAGNQTMLDWMKKDATVEQVLVTAERCVRHGIGAIFNFIVGFPGESEEDLESALRLVKRLRAMSPRFETPIFYFKPYPGSEITESVVERGFHLPESLEEWASFDFVGEASPWMGAASRRRVERFRFYNRFAWGPETWRRWPLQRLARWRCRHDFYGLPVEKVVVERLRPSPSLS